MWKVVILTGVLACTGTSQAAEYCKLKQYSDSELVARESVLVIDRGDSFSVRTSQTVFNSPLLKYGYAVDRQGVEYRHGTMESGKLWITLPWLKISLHIDCNSPRRSDLDRHYRHTAVDTQSVMFDVLTVAMSEI